MAELRHQNICGLAASVNNNLVHDFVHKNESTDDDGSCEMSFIVNENKKIHLQFLSPEKSISFIDSLGMLDHSNLNIYEWDAMNAAFENIDSFMESRSGTQKHVKVNQQIQIFIQIASDNFQL